MAIIGIIFANVYYYMTSKHLPSKLAGVTHFILRYWRRSLPLGLSFGLPQLLRAENQVDYRYEYYSEENNRMMINTHSVYFEQQLTDAATLKDRKAHV